MVLDDVEIFRGIVWTVEDTTSEELLLTAYDYLIYLNKSKVSYNFTNTTPEAAAAKVCKDFGILTGSLYVTSKKVSQLLSSVTAAEAINKMYDQVTLGGYLLTITGLKVNVIKKGLLISNYVLTINKAPDGNNSISNDYIATLDGMINRVNILDSNGVYHSFVENKLNENYGMITDEYTTQTGLDPATEAKKLLVGVGNTYTWEGIGNWTCQTGWLVNAKIFYLKSMNNINLIIDGDTHTWDVVTSKYTMQLNLVTP